MQTPKLPHNGNPALDPALNAELQNMQRAVAKLVDSKFAVLEKRLDKFEAALASVQEEQSTLARDTSRQVLSLRDDLNLLRANIDREIDMATLSITQAHVARLMNKSKKASRK